MPVPKGIRPVKIQLKQSPKISLDVFITTGYPAESEKWAQNDSTCLCVCVCVHMCLFKSNLKLSHEIIMVHKAFTMTTTMTTTSTAVGFV